MLDDAHKHRLAGVLAPRQDTKTAFAAAARHSRRVRVLKIAVPVVAVMVVLVPLLASSVVSMLRVSVPLGDFGRLVMSGNKLTMEAPRLAGFTKDNHGYEVSAKSANQDLSNPARIDLEQIRARLGLADNGWAMMDAKRGAYDTSTEILTLLDQIVLTSNNGYEGILSEAKIDVRAGTITSDQPLTLKWQQGDLKANSLEVRDKGQVMRFEGGVVMNIIPAQAKTASAAPDTSSKTTSVR